MAQQLSRKDKLPALPARVLQYGEGNFLRAFADWMLDVANEAGVTACGVAVVAPRFSHNRAISLLELQQGLYHVILEGFDRGAPLRCSRLIQCVSQILSPNERPQEYWDLVESPLLRFVITNTTEAGIRYEPDSILEGTASSFPGKITQMLWHRYRHFLGAPDKGLIFLCCELIEDNGLTLASLVKRHALEARLPKEFIKWVEEACIFANTLVDRIVSGFPSDTAAQEQQALGYDDDLIVKGEFFHLWVIGSPRWRQIQQELPLDRAALNVKFVPSVASYRTKKVRLLNATHTAMLPVALAAGCLTVADAISHPQVRAFVDTMLRQEVLPTMNGDPAENRTFADTVIERFLNPYIHHQLSSIALNTLPKWQTRCYPIVKDYFRKFGTFPPLETRAFAMLLHQFAPAASEVTMENAQQWVRGIFASDLFTEDFDVALPGFSRAVTAFLP